MKRVILIPMIPYKQLSLADIFQDCREIFNNDKPAFLSLLENHIDLDETSLLWHFCYVFKFGIVTNGLASSAIFIFIIKTLWSLILILLSKRNRILLTKVSMPMIQNCLSPPWKVSPLGHPLLHEYNLITPYLYPS